MEALSSASFFRPETKITLNNENETLSLFDPLGLRADFYSYPNSVKGEVLVRTGFSDDVCQVSPPAESGSFALPPAVGPDIPLPITDAPIEEASPVETSASQESAPDQAAEVSTSMETPPVPNESSASPQDGGTVTDSPSGDSDSADAVLEGAPFETGSTESAPDTGNLSEPTVGPTVPNPVPSVSRALAESLELVDSNGDGRFDFADIRYSEDLSGTADPAEFFLYSNTGGLYAARVATATGFFSTATIS